MGNQPLDPTLHGRTSYSRPPNSILFRELQEILWLYVIESENVMESETSRGFFGLTVPFVPTKGSLLNVLK